MTSLQLSAQEEAVERLLDAAARGDLVQVSSLLALGPSLLNRAGHSGWTALMLAARNGHYDVAQALLSLGCDKFSVNNSSQTAYDIATFWGHRHLADLLGRTGEGPPGSALLRPPGSALLHPPPENYFGRETLDRLSAKRTDRVWLEVRRSDPDAVYLLFSNLSPMVSAPLEGGGGGAAAETKLCRFGYEAVKDLLQKPATVFVFLGVERRKTPSSSSAHVADGVREPPAWFAINTDEDPAELLTRCGGKSCCFPKTPNRDLLRFSEEEAGVVAQARSVLAWHSRYSFCPTCGGGTAPEEAGHKRSCLDAGCRSRKGVHNTCYPRVGTQPEPWREVEEESGVQVGPVRYVSCQPWPMPSNLMIGCLAVAVSTAIKVDDDEIEEARWFPRQQVIDSFRGTRAAFTVPPRQTIAHQLIRHWVAGNSNL
ncbi:Peroxisomal NADH pyrophosphatase NUDT12 [Liparis tanakae]|uniref:NAD-capped RNA hydrolase NUDT12 n=1 Tax=Liparis tanakae TaxID=230148 RepID=A0A4Z2FAG2_9TELE|nr:Peroxisomal NADH pyrophosphatase NUDT12 [Liparis tanakae]